MPRKETGPVAVQTCMHGLSICSNYEYQCQIRKVHQTSRKGMQLLVYNSTVKLTLLYTAFIWEKLSSCPVGHAVGVNCDVVFNSCPSITVLG